MLDKETFAQRLAELPLFQYEFIDPRELTFSDRIRTVCEQECPMYNSTWACPPAVGTVEECRKRCLSYPHALMMTSVAEVGDIANMDETLSTRGPHEDLTHQVRQLLLDSGATDVYALSTEACTLCEQCAWPDHPCRHPDRMFPCVESHGIVVTEIAERYGIDFLQGNLVVWFSLLFYC